MRCESRKIKDVATDSDVSIAFSVFIASVMRVKLGNCEDVLLGADQFRENYY